jgi:hypothetical protein
MNHDLIFGIYFTVIGVICSIFAIITHNDLHAVLLAFAASLNFLAAVAAFYHASHLPNYER